METRATPAVIIPSFSAAPWDKSISRSATNGPRSFTRTTTEFPFSRLVTSSIVPNGSVLCAAVIAYISKISPLDVGRPWNASP